MPLHLVFRKTKRLPMSDRLAIHAIMCGMVGRVGQTAAAHAIQAFTDADCPDYGGLSRKVNGSRAWAIDDMLALQQACKGAPITDYLVERRPTSAKPASLFAAMAEASREGGEGMAAVARYAESLSAEDRASAIKEVREGRNALDGLLASLEAEPEPLHPMPRRMGRL